MIVLQKLLCLACVPIAFALFCRMDLLTWRETNWRGRTAMLMQTAMFMGVCTSCIYAWFGMAEWPALFVVIASASWIGLSWTTWKDGVPFHFQRSKTIDFLDTLREMDDAEMRHASGGKQ